MKVIIIYASRTGNNEKLANDIAKFLEEKRIQVTCKNVNNTNINELNDYDLILLGSSSFGDGKMLANMVPFMESIENLSNKKIAVFGTGSHNYPKFCGAVDLIEERIKEVNGTLISESLKLDDMDEDKEKKINNWVNLLFQYKR